MQSFSLTATVALIAFLSSTPLVTAHSWVEQLMVIAPNGTMVGQPGFPRNNVLRTSPTFSDTAMVWLIPPNGRPVNQIDAGQLMCRPEQTTQVQTSGSPRLKAAPGQSIALRYQENGHVSLPQNQPGKPVGSGGNFVYFTNESKPDDKFLQIHRQWTADGNGGDARGRLISTQNFDDGQCYQINGGTISVQRQAQFKHQANALQGADLWCQQDVQIPADAKVGETITLYWVWDWPTMPGTSGFQQGKQEIYTTCMDIDIVASTGAAKAAAKGFVQQDFGNAAVSGQFADITNPTAIKAETIPFSNAETASASVSTPSTSTSSLVATSTKPTPSSFRTISIQPVQTASSSKTSTTLEGPAQVTVTVQKTITATTFSTATRPPTVTVTNVETDFVTVLVTTATADKRESELTDGPSTFSTTSDVLTSEVVESSSPTQANHCNTTGRAYRLRRRYPLYILPSADQPESTAGSGCSDST